MYLAFRVILSYENKRSLTIEQLHNYRLKLCEKHFEYFSQYTEYDDKNFEKKLHYFHLVNMNMTREEEEQNFINFINDNDKFFSYKDGVIYLKDEIVLSVLEDENLKLPHYNDKDDYIICGYLISGFDCVDCLDILGVTKIKEFVSKLVEDEKRIENAYLIYSNDELEQNINKILESIYFRINILANLKEAKLRNYHRTILSLRDYEIDFKKIWLLSDYLMEHDEYYNLYFKSIDFIQKDVYQRAIFDKGTLAYDILNNMMEAIWTYRNPDETLEIELVDPEATSKLMEERENEIKSFKDEFEEDKDEIKYDEYEGEMNKIDIFLEEKRIAMTFYLNYINNINKYLKIHGQNADLESTKSRLLYFLDSYGDNLYKEENYQKTLYELLMNKIDSEEFDDQYTLSRLFLIDILEEWIDDELTLKKILFVSTYYDLTKDKRIKKIINKYKNTELGKKVYDVILNSNYQNLMSNFISETKKLMKKKNGDKSIK